MSTLDNAIRTSRSRIHISVTNGLKDDPDYQRLRKNYKGLSRLEISSSPTNLPIASQQYFEEKSSEFSLNSSLSNSRFTDSEQLVSSEYNVLKHNMSISPTNNCGMEMLRHHLLESSTELSTSKTLQRYKSRSNSFSGNA